MITPEGAAAGRRYAPYRLREEILRRDGYRCRYCRVKVTNETANIDHVVAWPEGMTVKLNLVTSCSACNLEKGRMYVIPRALKGSPFFWLRKPSDKDQRRWHKSVRVRRRRGVPDPWIREGPQRDGRT